MGLNKENKTILITVGAIVSLTSVYFIYNLSKRVETNKKANNDEIGGDNDVKPDDNEFVSSSAQNSTDSYPLSINMRGAKVFVLQSALNKLGQKITSDGVFGQQTYKAITNVDGWGFGANTACSFSYKCGLDYSEWNEIINKAKTKGFEVNKAWTEAKKLWKL